MCKRFLPLTFLLVLSCVASSLAQRYGSAMSMVRTYRDMEDRNSAKGKSYKRMSWAFATHRVQNSMAVTLVTPSDTRITKTIPLTTRLSIGGSTSTFSVLSKFSEQTALAFDYGIGFVGWSFRYDSLQFSDAYYKGTFSGDIPMICTQVPLSLDFKAGGEVSLQKEHALLLSAGVGIAPTMIMNDIAVRFAAKPFVKLELGFHAGIAFKLRGMFFTGDGNFIKDNGAIGSDFVKRRSIGNFGTTVSLAVMPFSWDWDRNKW